MLISYCNRITGRTQISEDQMTLLKAFYDINQKPSREEIQKLAGEIGQPFKVVKVWFQNARARDRRGSNSAASDADKLAKQFPNTVFGRSTSPGADTITIIPTKIEKTGAVSLILCKISFYRSRSRK